MNATVARALAKRAALPSETTCFRWVDLELPGITVDVFGDVAVLSDYRPSTTREEEVELATQLCALHPLAAVYVKRRPREARRAQRTEHLAPAAPVVGRHVPLLIAHENGIAFEIQPSNGLSVGLYLDARDVRSRVGSLAKGRSVLNLFSYTCGFGLAALRGGATRAVNVDLSRRVLDWGERNLRLNGLTPTRQDFVAGESIEWLGRFRRKDERFGMVVLDPPSFATSNGVRFSAARDYPALVRAAAEVLAPEGLLVACCNLEMLSPQRFEALVLEGLPTGVIVERFGASAVDFAQPSALKVLIVSRGR